MEKGQESKLQAYLTETFGDSVRPYIGRGMDGKRCLAVVTDSPRDVLAYIAGGLYHRELGPEGITAIRCHRTDGMGRYQIIYFPHVEFVEPMKIEKKP